jgi:hypothetical protein
VEHERPAPRFRHQADRDRRLHSRAPVDANSGRRCRS